MLVHFLYGEDDFRFAALGRRLNPQARITATSHHGQAAFENVVSNRQHMATLDAVIAVGINQVPYFEGLVGPGRVHYVPHGIHTDFFRPPPSRPFRRGGEKRCLFVGQWLRDFACLREVIHRVTTRHRHVVFHVITTPNGLQELGPVPGAHVQTGVSDEALRAAYQAADMLVLPLLDATANCAILEAMACGLPIVTTDVGGVRGYVDAQCALLAAPGNAEEMAANVSSLLADDARRRRMGIAAREKALKEFDIRIATEKLRKAHREIMNGPPRNLHTTSAERDCGSSGESWSHQSPASGRR